MTGDEVCLVLRGWAEAGARLRVLLRMPDSEMFLSAFCTLIDAKDDVIAFWLEGSGKTSGLEVNLRGCECEFTDAPEDNREHPAGVTVESCVLANRLDFEFFVMRLSDD
jgi:hypothetical protein